MLRRLLSLLLILGAGPLAQAHDAPSPTRFGAGQRDFTQRHLEIRLRPDLAQGTVAGHVTLTLASEVEALRRVRLHAVDMAIHAVRDDEGGFLVHALQEGILTVELPAPLAEGEEARIHIRYLAMPRRGLFFHRPAADTPNRPLLVYSQGQSSDNRRWIPCYDEPDDRTRWDLFVEVPEHLQTISNGILVDQDRTDEGIRRDHWQFSDRAPTYLISLVIGDFETISQVHGDTTLTFHAPRGHGTHLAHALRHTGGMLDFFEDWLDAPYPWPSYAQVLVWDFLYGGMENVTATTLNMRVLHEPEAEPDYRADGLVAHELIHMWFGDWITCRTWKHLWLNEGFATYFTDLWFEHTEGRDAFLLRRRRQNEDYLQGTPDASALRLTRSPRGDQPLELDGGKAYDRGAAILHMLREELGDDVFQQAIRHYVRTHRDEAVTSEQLRNALEHVSGRDLEGFFRQWVYGAGYPHLDIDLLEDPVERTRVLRVRQVQTQAHGQGLFACTLPIRRSLNGPVERLRIWRQEHRFFLGRGEVPAVQVNVGESLLARIRLRQATTSWVLMLDQARDPMARLDAVAGLAPSASDPWVQGRLVQAVGQERSWAVRRALVQLLARTEGAAAQAALLHATKDEDSRVRVAAADALGATRRDMAGATLVTLAGEDPSPYVRAAAARSLGRLHVPEAHKLLALLLQQDSHVDIVRQGALDGLRHLGDPAHVPLALPFLAYRVAKGATHAVRERALACVLGLAPDDPSVHARVVGLLDDPYHRMRQWAATACGTHGMADAVPALRSLSRTDWHGGVRRAAHQALQRLGADHDDE